MKKVTSWAAIIAVPTLITGFYGMNVPYPGYAQNSGAAIAAVLILVMSGALYALFRRRRLALTAPVSFPADDAAPAEPQRW